MAASPRRIPVALVLALGASLGWLLHETAGVRSLAQAQVRGGPAAKGQAGDTMVAYVTDLEARVRDLEKRMPTESIVVTGPVSVEHNKGKNIQLPLEALYYLDYGRASLSATIPSIRQSLGPTRVIDQFASRDLIVDFKIDTNKVRPRFRMVTGALGTYSDGCSPLYVFETVTNQVAVYKVMQQSYGAVTTPKFELLEVSSIDAKTARLSAR